MIQRSLQLAAFTASAFALAACTGTVSLGGHNDSDGGVPPTLDGGGPTVLDGGDSGISPPPSPDGGGGNQDATALDGGITADAGGGSSDDAGGDTGVPPNGNSGTITLPTVCATEFNYSDDAGPVTPGPEQDQQTMLVGTWVTCRGSLFGITAMDEPMPGVPSNAIGVDFRNDGTFQLLAAQNGALVPIDGQSAMGTWGMQGPLELALGTDQAVDATSATLYVLYPTFSADGLAAYLTNNYEGWVSLAKPNGTPPQARH